MTNRIYNALYKTNKDLMDKAWNKYDREVFTIGEPNRNDPDEIQDFMEWFLAETTEANKRGFKITDTLFEKLKGK
jgi:hypothetical protein